MMLLCGKIGGARDNFEVFLQSTTQGVADGRGRKKGGEDADFRARRRFFRFLLHAVLPLLSPFYITTCLLTSMADVGQEQAENLRFYPVS